MAKKRGFLSKLFGKAKRYLTEERTISRTRVSGGGGAEPEISEDELGAITEYAETGEWPEEIVEDVDIPIYEVEEETTVSTRSYVPGPDPSKLRSGDLLTTAAFYGVTDEEYTQLEDLINVAYIDPASSESERRAAIREIQDAMSMLHARARDTEDFDWATWRDEVYGGKR